MSYGWNHKDLPHKGWQLVDVIDLRESGQSEEETEYETCMMCGNEKIRYVHVVYHRETDTQLNVGCVCAEKMTNDYVNPRQRETALRNRAGRRATWKRKQWNVSQNGNLYLNVDRRHLLIFLDKNTNRYKVKIGEVFGKKSFDSVEKAKLAAFDGMEYLKEKGKW